MEKATRQQTKFHNQNLVLKTIYHEGDISRADIARITRLTRTTVSDIVAELIHDGFLEETGVGSSGGGKPPILLSIRDQARHFLCLDLSGRQFQGAVVDLRGKIVQHASVSLNGKTGPDALQCVYQLVDELKNSALSPLAGLGAGVAGLTNGETGVVLRAVSLEWNDLPLKQLLEERYDLPAYVLNDSHAAALAEVTFGTFRQAPNLIVVRVGEGIGAGILLAGQIYSGDGSGAGEIGHLTVVAGGRRCSCGNYGCLETVASPRSILQRVHELAEYEWISFANHPAFDPARMDWDFVRQAFRSHDETVTELVKEAGRYLGISIANLVSILNVHRIVLSGSYVEFGADFLEAVREEVKQRVFPMMAANTQVVNSTLEPYNVILGMSALLLANEIGLP